jgi:uncharacterized protein involved in response to NO
METEQTYTSRMGSLWRVEPFRFFFVLGVLLSWVGVGHWLFYAIGVTATYSCELHGLIQVQGFLMAFAVGFLLTALPRRTQSAPPTDLEMVIIAGALVESTVASLLESWAAAQLGYVVVFAVLVRFALTRFLGVAAGRRPPAAFVLIPIGILHALTGAALIVLESLGAVPQGFTGLGKLLVGQGVFLCFIVGVGSLVLPLMSGSPPPADLGSSPAETRKAVLYAAAGGAIFASLLIEQLGWPSVGASLRAIVVVLALGRLARRAPGKPGLHRGLVWTSVWLIPSGLALSALWPDYRVPALHLMFIGGFGMMAFGVATHVSLTHMGMEQLSLGRPWPVIALGVTFAMSLTARVAADASDTYFEHLGWASGLWVAGTAAWLTFFLPRFLRPPPAVDP